MNDAEGNGAKAIQDAESSGLTDLTASLCSEGVVLSGVKDGGAKTDVGAAKTDVPGLELREPKLSDPKRSDRRLPCNFDDEEDDLDFQHEDVGIGRNFCVRFIQTLPASITASRMH